MSVLDTVEETIRRHAMLAGGETVLVAVSGGADSVALLHALRLLAPRWRLALRVLHVDHGLRPDSSRDAEFVRALGRRLEVPVDVVAVAVVPAGSLEAAAREARYAALDAHADRLGAQRIALGHTADDQAETVLMRVLGGAGMRGLAGIPAVRGRVIRPLLGLRRRDLLGELREAGLDWVEDPSNLDPKFLRNRIRHELLPFLQASYDADVVEALNRVARLARESVETIERTATIELDRLAGAEAGPLPREAAPSREAIVLRRSALAALPPPVGAEILRLAARRLGGRTDLRAWGHRGLRRVLAAPQPRRPFRLGGVTVEVSGDRVRIASRPSPRLVERALAVPGRVAMPEVSLALEATLRTVREPASYRDSGDRFRVAFDADRLPPSLLVRARRPGDRFTPFGGGERRLKSFLIDAKVPRWDRRRLPLVEAAGDILWLAGLRRSATAPVTAQTRRVLELALIPLAEAGAGG